MRSITTGATPRTTFEVGREDVGRKGDVGVDFDDEDPEEDNEEEDEDDDWVNPSLHTPIEPPSTSNIYAPSTVQTNSNGLISARGSGAKVKSNNEKAIVRRKGP